MKVEKATPLFSGWRHVPFRDFMLASVVAANVAMLVFYEVIAYRFFFHSDAAAVNLISEEIVRSGQFFPRDWNFVNGDLFVIFGHLFIMPFIPFVKNGFGLHAVAGIVATLIILASTWFLLIRMGVSRTGRLVVLAILTSGISPYLAENLYGQVSYGTVLYLILLQLASVLSFFRARRDGRAGHAWLALCALATLTFLAMLANPFRGLATYTLPIFGSLILGKLLVRSSVVKGGGVPLFSWRDLSIAGAVTLVAMVAGGLGHAGVMTTINNVPGAGDARLLGPDEILRHIAGAIRGWLYLSGGLFEPGSRLLSPEGLYVSVRLVASIATLSFPYWAYRLALRNGDEPRSVVAMCSFLCFVLVLFFFIFSTVPDMSSEIAIEGSSRYFTVPLVMMLIVVASTIDCGACDWRQNVGAMIALTVFSVASLSIGFVTLVCPVFAAVSDGGSITYRLVPSDVEGIVGELQRRGLRYGYASYWSANVVSVMSDSEQRIRPIVVGPIPRPMRHLSSNFWYRPAAWQGPTFFLLTDAEYAAIDWTSMKRYLGAPATVVRFEPRTTGWTSMKRNLGAPSTVRYEQSTIVVYPFNVADRLPEWDDQLTQPMTLPMMGATPHQIGRFDEANQAMVGDGGQTGYLVFGPYVGLPAGRYRATFDLETDETDDSPVGFVEIFAGPTTTLARSDILPARGRRELSVAFALDSKAEQVEFRVFLNGKAGVKVRQVTVGRTEVDRPSDSPRQGQAQSLRGPIQPGDEASRVVDTMRRDARPPDAQVTEPFL